MVLVIHVMLSITRWDGCHRSYRHLLSQVTDPDEVDATGTQPELRSGACLKNRLGDHLAEDGIDAHSDALGRHNGNRAIAAVNLDAVARARVIPALAMHLAVGFMPLNLSQGRISQSQREHKCQYDQQSSHRF